MTPEQTPTPKSTPTLAMVEGPLPEILINLGTNYWDWCFRDKEGPDQIWYASYPYDEFHLILSDPSIDYKFPTWSPSGNWIAYVESNPIEIQVGSDQVPTDNKGSDSVWIMRPDGSDKRRVSDYVSRVDSLWVDSCYTASYIKNAPKWSPDERHLTFTHLDIGVEDPNLSYYLVELDTGKTELLHSQLGKFRGIFSYPPPVWISNNEVVIVLDKNEVLKIDIDTREYVAISPPLDIPQSSRLLLRNISERFGPQVINRDIIVSFHDLDSESFHSLWQLNVDDGVWTQIKDLQDSFWGDPYIVGRSLNIACGDFGIFYVLDKKWDIVGTYAAPEHTSSICRNVHILQAKGDALVSFVDYISKDDHKVIEYGIWVMNLQSRDPVPELIVDRDYLPKSVRYIYLNITDYSWRPLP
jgi:hypothetical protein